MPCYPNELFSLTGSVAAANFSAPPNIALMGGDFASQVWQVDYEILGVQLTSSLTNYGAATMGVFVILGANTPVISYGNSTEALNHNITGTNSLVGPPAVPIPSDKSVPRVFLSPILVRKGTRIALYAMGDTTAGNALTAFASLDMRQVG